jgi:hypothetical protein
MTEQQQKVVDAFSDLQILQKEMAKDPEKEELFDDVVSKCMLNGKTSALAPLQTVQKTEIPAYRP